MNGKLRALGLALLVTFALGAIGAQGAIAEGEYFHSGSEPTYLTGHQISGTNEIKLDDGSETAFGCANATFETTAAVSKTFSEFTVHPEYSACSLFEEGDTVFFTEGCYYTFTSGLRPTTEEKTEHAPLEMECDETHTMQLVVSGLCVIDFDPNQSEEELTHGVVYENELNEQGSQTYIVAEVTVHGIHWEVETPFFCTVGGLKGHTGIDGTYFNQITFEGFSDADHNNHTPIWWE